MLILKEVKASSWKDKVCLFSTVVVDRSLLRPCQTFYKQQDRYGREQIFLFLPLEGRIVRKGELTTIKYSQNHKTFILWSRSPQLQFDSNKDTSISILTLPDTETHHSILFYYHLISARKGTQVIVRDDDEEMTLVF